MLRLKLPILFLMLVSCEASSVSQLESQTEGDTTETQIAGSDRDEHQCIGSAGYTWSTLTNRCIRPFELGLRLNSVGDSQKTHREIAGIAFNTDSSKAELFGSPWRAGVVLKRENEQTWTGGNVRLVKKPWAIRIKDSIAYEE